MTSALSAFAVGIGRRSWIIAVVAVVACAALAARTVNTLVADRFLADPPRAAEIPPTPRAPEAPKVEHASTKSGDALVDRNMFCSDCTAAVAVGPAAPSGETPITSLPLVLVATSVGSDAVATIRDDRSGSQGAYGIGDVLHGAGSIERIAGTFVEFHDDGTNRTERILLLGLAPAISGAGVGAGGPAVVAAADAPFADRVKKIDDNNYEVERSLVRDLVTSGGKGTGVRMMPITKDGKLAGMKVISARADSIAAAMGLRNGDALTTINGITLDSPDALLDAYAKLNDASHVVLEGTRAGKPLSLDYRLH